MHHHLEQAQVEIDRALTRATAADLGSPCQGKWTAAQIVEHLALAFVGTRAALEKALASGELRGKRPALRQRLARVLVNDVGYFPRVEAPKQTTPTGSIAAELARQTITEALAAMDVALTSAETRFGASALVANHPYFAGLTVAQWRKFHWRHTRHHMRQIRAFLADPSA